MKRVLKQFCEHHRRSQVFETLNPRLRNSDLGNEVMSETPKIVSLDAPKVVAAMV